MKIILNNKKIIEDILKNKIVPSDKSIRSIISMMIKLFHEQFLETKDDEYIKNYESFVEMNKIKRLEMRNKKRKYSPKLTEEYKQEAESLITLVKKEIESFNLSVLEYEEYKFIKYIKSECESTIGFNRKLRNIENIKVYKEESDFINEISTNDNEKKILFTLTCICRSQMNNGYVNLDYISDSELFKMANITGTKDKKMTLLYDLEKKDIIKNSMSGIYINEYSNNVTESVDFIIEEFENLGNLFLGKYKIGYKPCKNCGKPIKITGNGRPKTLCTLCAKENRRINVNNSMKRYYERKKKDE